MEEVQVYAEKAMLVIQAEAFQTKADAMVVDTDEHVMAATNLLGYIKQSKDQFEGKRTDIVKPLNDRVREINSAFKDIMAPLDTANTTLKNKVVLYNREQERKRQEALAKQREEEEQLKRDEEAKQKAIDESLLFGEPVFEEVVIGIVEQPVLPPVPEVKTMFKAQLGSTSMRKVWKFDVTDTAAVPKEYLVVDEKKIRAAVSAGTRDIPGVHIYQDDTLRVGRGSF